MRMRVLGGLAALAIAGACAHGSTRSDTVSDEALARVPPDQMGNVNQARLDVSKAKDNLARENLGQEKAKRYLDVANNEVSIAKAQQDRDAAAQKAADYARNDQAATESQSAMGLARQREQVAAAHVKAAQELSSYSAARVSAAQKAVDLANARLEQAKFKAVQASGDPAAANIDGAAIAKRVEDTRVALEQERTKVAQAKASASAARTSWIALRDQLPADQRFGVGGSGTNSGTSSDTAANLSGQTGTNQTNAGRENYNIDTRNTDPNKGPMSNNPALYDDKDLFNLL
jgi:colicin import membrane protein